MLRRLAVGLAGLAATAITIAGCASGGTNQTLSIGPSIPPQTLYATNSTQNGISIYSSAMAGGGPEYQISTGGTTSGLNGPQYLTFDSSANIFTTNWQPSLKVGGIVEIKAQATGNVLPFNGYSFGAAHPRGIADYLATTASSPTKPVDVLVAAVVDPTQPLSFSSQLQLFVASVLGAPIETIAGPNTGLNVPSGVAFDAAKNVYVTNLQGASVEEFSIPTPSPTPTATATASASPTTSPSVSPSATASAPATPTPTPEPTATPVNIAPVRTLTSGVGEPTGVAIDGNGGIWVSDQKAAICGCPAILYFAKGATTPTAISGSATKLYAPTDVKVDSSGKIYVADSTPPSGAGVIYVFAANATGNVAPSTTYTSPGTVIGLGLAP